MNKPGTRGIFESIFYVVAAITILIFIRIVIGTLQPPSLAATRAAVIPPWYFRMPGVFIFFGVSVFSFMLGRAVRKKS